MSEMIAKLFSDLQINKFWSSLPKPSWNSFLCHMTLKLYKIIHMYINDTLQIDPLEQRVQHPKQICIKFLSEINRKWIMIDSISP